MSFFSNLFGGPDINELAAAARETEGAIILDVRSPDEYRGGHLEGAMDLPLVAIPATASQRLRNKQAPLFVYCLSGARSAQACRELTRQGYENVTDMGGINRWSGPVVR